MSRMLQDIQTRTFSKISRTPIPPDFTFKVVPSYEHGELILKNHGAAPGDDPNASEVLSSKEVVYSEVYPNGSGASQGTHLSVFLEMVEGGNEAAKYEYGIELLHWSRPNQRIVRKFSSDFEARIRRAFAATFFQSPSRQVQGEDEEAGSYATVILPLLQLEFQFLLAGD